MDISSFPIIRKGRWLEAPLATQEDDDNKVIIGCRSPHIDVGRPQSDDGESMNDGEAEGDADNNDKAPSDPLGVPVNPEDLVVVVGLKDSKDPWDQWFLSLWSFTGDQMLGYNEGQILEIVKKTLPTRHYSLLFCVQIIRQAVESAKHIIIKEKLDKLLTGQSSTLYILLKTHPYERCKSVKFDEYKLLGNQIDRLAEVMAKMSTRDLGR